VVVLEEVSKSFGPVRAVERLTLAIRPGRITGLLGRNGAGKTTTLRMINAIFLPDAGTVTVFGARAAAAVRDRVGYLPEERGLYRKMKVLEQLLFLAEIKGRRAASVAASPTAAIRSPSTSSAPARGGSVMVQQSPTINTAPV
jgi:ABC-2 type transport system ATP-binding protein